MSTTYYNKHNTPYKIVEFIDGGHVIVQFQDEYKALVKTVTEAAIKGGVKNPYDKICFGIGCIGDGKYKSQIGDKKTPVYQCWLGMLCRCYNEGQKHKHPAYYGISTVCDEWFDFQNFAKWYEKNFYQVGKERMHLDKDILIRGNKIYSPQTCLIVPQRINLIFMDYQRGTDSDLPTGINRSWHKDGTCNYRAMYNAKTVGTFSTLDEAIEQYLRKKRENISGVAEKYKNVLPKKVYDALIAW